MINLLNRLFLTLLFGLLVLTACSDDEKVSWPMGDTDAFGFTTLDDAKTHLGVYADIFTPIDGSVDIRATQYGAVSERPTNYSLRGSYYDPITAQSKSIGTFNVGPFKLNFDTRSNSYVRTSQQSDNSFETGLSPLFGAETDVFFTSRRRDVVQIFTLCTPASKRLHCRCRHIRRN